MKAGMLKLLLFLLLLLLLLLLPFTPPHAQEARQQLLSLAAIPC